MRHRASRPHPLARVLAGVSASVIASLLGPATAVAAPLQEAPSEDEVPSPAEEPVTEKEVEDAVQRCVEILLEMQEPLDDSKDGEPFRARARRKVPAEWPYQGVYRVNGKIPMGYRVGGTSIAAWSLLDAPGWERDAKRRKAVERALEFVLEGLDHPLMSAGFEGRYDVRGWGHAYALIFLLRMRELESVPRKHGKAVEEAIDWLVATLQETEIAETGGWNYSRRKGGDAPAPASTFMTAPTLQALFAAAAQEEPVDPAVVERALRTLEEARVDNSAFQYGTQPDRRTGQGFEAVPGAIGRMAVCETTLALAGRGDLERVRGAIEAFFEHWGWLEIRRRQNGTHVRPYMIAPYYFFYAHFYVAQAIEMLPESERPALRARLESTLFGVREESGGWNDRVFPRSENFGTAMTLLAFTRPDVGAPARWSTPVAAKKGQAEPGR